MSSLKYWVTTHGVTQARNLWVILDGPCPLPRPPFTQSYQFCLLSSSPVIPIPIPCVLCELGYHNTPAGFSCHCCQHPGSLAWPSTPNKVGLCVFIKGGEFEASANPRLKPLSSPILLLALFLNVKCIHLHRIHDIVGKHVPFSKIEPKKIAFGWRNRLTISAPGEVTSSEYSFPLKGRTGPSLRMWPPHSLSSPCNHQATMLMLGLSVNRKFQKEYRQ